MISVRYDTKWYIYVHSKLTKPILTHFSPLFSKLLHYIMDSMPGWLTDHY